MSESLRPEPNQRPGPHDDLHPAEAPTNHDADPLPDGGETWPMKRTFAILTLIDGPG
jgi:hypothetical protein